MIPEIQKLIAAGAADAQRCLGSQGELSRGGEVYWQGRVVWVETASSYAVELGGAVCSVTGRATILAADMEGAPQAGDRLQVNGRLCLVVGCFRSPYDATYNLETSTLK